jgi:DNA replication licensing factor MCM2
VRRESNIVGGIPIAVRHIESVLRMSEAHAKMFLRDYVRSDDIDQAIQMLLESFLQSQKQSVAR